ncbi:MAG: hypothetical protein WBA74_26235 [Cyclobacteriaceae bacterium]
MKKLIYSALTLTIIGVGLSSCTVNDDFEDVKIETVESDSGSGTTGNNGSSVGQNKPPFPK